MDTVFMIIAGIAAGIIGGMGMGGGTLLIPVLNIFFAVKQHTAQAVNLVAFIPMSIAALAVHIKNKLIDYKKALIIIIPACVTATAGAFAAKYTDSKSLQKFFGGFLILLAAFQVIIFVIDYKKKKTDKNISEK
jgi:uncharacterized membrane protein YfcA